MFLFGMIMRISHVAGSLLLSIRLIPICMAMQIRRPWTTKDWCESVVSVEWPFAYSKIHNQTEERKGRVLSNDQDMRHVCQTRGVQSKCHICEDITCGYNRTEKCTFQVQGVSSSEMSRNIPTITDVPWAVGGLHRYDFGNEIISHVCMYLSSVHPCQSNFGDNYSRCIIRCWGFDSPRGGHLPGDHSLLNGLQSDVWSNARGDFVIGVNSTPWTLPAPTQTWNFPKYNSTLLRNIRQVLWSEYYTPQGFVFTFAGSGDPGFVDGQRDEARFRNPEGVAIDHYGNVFVADTGNHAIRVVSPLGHVRTLAGTGKEGFLDGSSEHAQFSSPSHVAIWRGWQHFHGIDPVGPSDLVYRDQNGTIQLFVSDTGNHRIRKIIIKYEYNDSSEYIPTTVKVECFSGLCGKLPRPGLSDGMKSFARFDSPRGIAVSDDGKVYVADSNNNLVRTINQFGVTETIAGTIEIRQETSFDFPETDCPEPCSFGVPGYEDGNSMQAKFIFPTGIALSADRNSLFVVDQQYLREISLIEKEVFTIAGGVGNSERDGYGREAAFFHPEGITISQDGFIFITDSASCRIRRVSNQSNYLVPLKCHRSFASVLRPSGCASYNAEIDEFGIGVTPMSGPIYYNFAHRNRSHSTFGDNFIGRSLKDCIGSPPPNGKLSDHDKINELRDDPNEGTMIRLVCPSSCASLNGTIFGVKYYDFILYSEVSSICLSAFYAGILEEATGGLIEVIEHKKPSITGLKYFAFHGLNGERNLTLKEFETHFGSASRLFSLNRASMDFVVHTISGAPTKLTENPCGFLDFAPAQGAKFRNPMAIASFVNNTNKGRVELLFVADRGNHVIRALTPVCTFICENGGRCVSADRCECEDGWEGEDCSIPICQNSCGYRELCVAPDKCSCIPGYTGSNCETPLCVQMCMNDGYCSAPDTCQCAEGWFDSNCTTPVCKQTCGNGGNCTAPNYCSCPTDWTGTDCRTPVCEQECLNGGMCVAPNTCQCPPDWTGFECANPVCTQGFFEPYTENDLMDQNMYWIEYRPCNMTEWCEYTNSFECYQDKLELKPKRTLHGDMWRFKIGRSSIDNNCLLIELRPNAITWYQYLFANGTFTHHARYSNTSSFDDDPQKEWSPMFGKILSSEQSLSAVSSDRQLALVEMVEVIQGEYKCANGGKCIAPDTCSCKIGWIGFDCRTPVCDQGYYQAGQRSFVKGMNDDFELQVFQNFLSQNQTYRLDPFGNGYSNPIYETVTERFVDAFEIVRKSEKRGGEPYISNVLEPQGGYQCSIRAYTEWESPDFLFEHPNYFSRYMDTKTEDDGNVYTYWKNMSWGATHKKSDSFVLKESSLNISGLSQSNKKFVYTDLGYQMHGYWSLTGSAWTKGRCIVEFKRVCTRPVELRDLESNLSVSEHNIFVQDPDLAFRARKAFDDSKDQSIGMWSISDGECIDQVIRGCFNNGTCISPNVCQCADGWTGYDCTIPRCKQMCLNNGNCTFPDICTCERGWTGHDCSKPICSQECNNGGICIAPDTCKCKQWENIWRDGRIDGGVPIFQTPSGDPQMTGWTGYDCSTPICVQAEEFVFNINPDSFDWIDLRYLDSGGGNMILNDGKSFQTGCGSDPLMTGCCYEQIDNHNKSWYKCLKCDPDKLLINVHDVSCPSGALMEWNFSSIDKIPGIFKYHPSQSIRTCGPYHHPRGEEFDVSKHPHPTIPHRNTLSDYQLTSDYFLCNRFEWEQGNFIDNSNLVDDTARGSEYLLELGRHIRVNYYNYIKNGSSYTNDWYIGDSFQGEGIFACYNGGGCIAPDTCSCRDGYTGFDCRTPICRFFHDGSAKSGCLNGGLCVDKDKCECLQTPSVLWLEYKQAERGWTGYSGKDCSMPICTQGYFDPTCDARNGSDTIGCYKCHNGGICVAPDECECSEGWTGYDCKTPVCTIQATNKIVEQLMTNDREKVKLFEMDPCGMKGFNGWLEGEEFSRGHCVLPNKCTCTCKIRYDSNLCRALGGNYCRKPFEDSLSKYRNILSPNEVFGSRSCSSGYEGTVDEDNDFTSCHLNIYEPTYFVKYSIPILLFSFILGILLIRTCIRPLTLRDNTDRDIHRGNWRRDLPVVPAGHAFTAYKGNILKSD